MFELIITELTKKDKLCAEYDHNCGTFPTKEEAKDHLNQLIKENKYPDLVAYSIKRVNFRQNQA